MAATTAPRKTPRRNSAYDMKWDFPVAAATTIYHGTWVGVNATKDVVPAGTAGSTTLGRAHCSNGVSAAAGEMVRIDQGIFAWENPAGIGEDDIGNIVFAIDNQSADDAGTVQGGILVDVDSEGAWVLSGFGVGTLEIGA